MCDRGADRGGGSVLYEPYCSAVFVQAGAVGLLAAGAELPVDERLYPAAVAVARDDRHGVGRSDPRRTLGIVIRSLRHGQGRQYRGDRDRRGVRAVGRKAVVFGGGLLAVGADRRIARADGEGGGHLCRGYLQHDVRVRVTRSGDGAVGRARERGRVGTLPADPEGRGQLPLDGIHR